MYLYVKKLLFFKFFLIYLDFFIFLRMAYGRIFLKKNLNIFNPLQIFSFFSSQINITTFPINIISSKIIKKKFENATSLLKDCFVNPYTQIFLILFKKSYRYWKSCTFQFFSFLVVFINNLVTCTSMLRKSCYCIFNAVLHAY